MAIGNNFTNNTQAALIEPLIPAATTINLPAIEVSKFFQGPFTVDDNADSWQLATLTNGTDYEIVRIVDVPSTTSLLVDRAQEGTVALSFSIGDTLFVTSTAESLNKFRADIVIADASILLLDQQRILMQAQADLNTTSAVTQDSNISTNASNISTNASGILDINNNLINSIVTANGAVVVDPNGNVTTN